MSKFDTHGGYFAPKDYLKVNEGGSHEENPNGGVQIGVDPEGTPNLLEEGEPVYKDYVYSDNIQAEREFLEQNHLPGKYEGKLYSKIADDILTEAEERPLDPISRNGLEVLLGRLADAQEGQKQAKEQKDLENELSQLSPEELDQLEAMLAQEQSIGTDNPLYGEGPVGAQGEPGIPPEQMTGPAEPMPVEGMPMMANGGFLRVFDEGTPGRVVPEGASTGGGSRDKFDTLNYGDYYVEPQLPSLLETALGSDNKVVETINDAQEWWNSSTIGKVANFVLPEDATQAFGSPLMRQTGRVLGPVGRSIGRGLKKAGKAILKTPGKLIEWKGRGEMLKEAGAVVKEAKAASAVARETANAVAEEVKAAKAALAADPSNKALQQALAEVEARSAKADVEALKASAKATGARIEATNKAVGAVTGGPMYNREALAQEIQGLQKKYEAAKAAAEAAPNGQAEKEALEAALKELEDAKGFWNKWWKHGEWKYKVPLVATGAGVKLYDNKKDSDQEWIDSQYAEGGFLKTPPKSVNRFDDGGWAAFFKLLEEYQGSRGRSRSSGKYAIDRNAAYWKNTAREIEALDNYRAFTDYVKTHPNDPNVLKYFSYLDKGINRDTGARTLLNPDGSLADDWLNTFNYRRTDGNLGIYHISPEDIAFLTSPKVDATSSVQTVPSQGVAASSVQAAPPANAESSATQSPDPLKLDLTGIENGIGVDENGNAVDSIEPSGVVAYRTQKPQGRPAPVELYPTTPRYAGAFGSSLLGLYNLFQSPDYYTATRINPYVPEGRINLQNQVYNPVDQNMVANQMIAQGNATRRALGNSGMGPSAGAAILAADNNLTGNLGTGFIQTWDANNQRRNAVIAANNQAESQRAQFDFNVDQQRKAALRDAAVRNAQNDLLLQRLNYEAEGQKYAAVGNQLDQALSALSDIGRENFSANQINNNPALGGYMIDKSGRTVYFPSFAQSASLEGFLKKLKK